MIILDVYEKGSVFSLDIYIPDNLQEKQYQVICPTGF